MALGARVAVATRPEGRLIMAVMMVANPGSMALSVDRAPVDVATRRRVALVAAVPDKGVTVAAAVVATLAEMAAGSQAAVAPTTWALMPALWSGMTRAARRMATSSFPTLAFCHRNELWRMRVRTISL